MRVVAAVGNALWLTAVVLLIAVFAELFLYISVRLMTYAYFKSRQEAIMGVRRRVFNLKGSANGL